jgi:polyisoprenoid-binding protein YceI
MIKNRSYPAWPALTALLLICGNGANAEPADWRIDPEHFSISFAADHVGFQQQLGLFLEAEGSFRYDIETRQLSSGRVEIQADSVFSNHRRRDNHLRSDDFLNARRHPLIVFEVSAYTPGSTGNSGVLTGDLTLLGITQPAELEVTINKQARYPFGHRRETLGISARTTILRSRWGMDYGIADNLVGDEVTLRFEFEALQQ